MSEAKCGMMRGEVTPDCASLHPGYACFIKKSQKTPPRELELARQRAKEIT
jgi:hypothetical protein